VGRGHDRREPVGGRGGGGQPQPCPRGAGVLELAEVGLHAGRVVPQNSMKSYSETAFPLAVAGEGYGVEPVGDGVADVGAEGEVALARGGGGRGPATGRAAGERGAGEQCQRSRGGRHQAVEAAHLPSFGMPGASRCPRCVSLGRPSPGTELVARFCARNLSAGWGLPPYCDTATAGSRSKP
jgi:hypothetical protein